MTRLKGYDMAEPAKLKAPKGYAAFRITLTYCIAKASKVLTRYADAFRKLVDGESVKSFLVKTKPTEGRKRSPQDPEQQYVFTACVNRELLPLRIGDIAELYVVRAMPEEQVRADVQSIFDGLFSLMTTLKVEVFDEDEDEDEDEEEKAPPVVTPALEPILPVAKAWRFLFSYDAEATPSEIRKVAEELGKLADNKWSDNAIFVFGFGAFSSRREVSFSACADVPLSVEAKDGVTKLKPIREVKVTPPSEVQDLADRLFILMKRLQPEEQPS